MILFNDVEDAVAYEVVYGAVNEDIFNEFVASELLPHVEPYPGKHSIIMIDNCKFHHNVDLQEMVDASGAILLFLPSYKPNWNLSEFWFNGIKGKERAAGVYGNVDEARLSLCESVEAMRGCDWTNKLKEIGYMS